MKKLTYVFAVLLVFGMFAARPAYAQMSNSEIQSLLATLIAQVQELQRQLVELQRAETEATQSSASFASDASLVVVSPEKGDTLKAGESVSVEWKSDSALINEPLELRLKSPSCATTNYLLAAGIKNNGSYTWKVSEDLVSEKCDYNIYLMVSNVKSSVWTSSESGAFQIVR